MSYPYYEGKEITKEEFTMKKRVFTLILALVMVMTLLPANALALEDLEPNDTLRTAQEFTVGDAISGSISESEDADWYQFTLEDHGRVSCSVVAYMDYYSMWLYDDEGNKLWESYGNQANSDTGIRKDTHNLDLTEGTFFLKISGQYTYGISNRYATGDYRMTTTFSNANINEVEPNNTIQEAQLIPLNGSIVGQCALNNNQDYFKLELPADGQLTLTIAAAMEHYSMWLYDDMGIELWSDCNNSATSATGMSNDTYNICLNEGTYYICVSGRYSSGLNYSYATGNYTLDTTYVCADVDETEPNDTIQDAERFPLNTAFNGMCTLNNRYDYYKIELPADTQLTLSFISYMDHYTIWILDYAGNEVWSRSRNPFSSSPYTDTSTHNLVQGTYYIKVSGQYSNGLSTTYANGNYTLKLNTENPFTDVPSNAFYYDPVLWAVYNNITTGATATTFNPGGSCLRAHVVTFLHRAAGNPESTSANNPFTDVKSTDFFYKPVLWAVEKGITNGTSATKFGSYDTCNRAAVVTFLWRAKGQPEPESTTNPFVDVKESDFYYKAVLWAVENGITNGVDATHFGPTTACNRAQVVTFLYRAYN